MEDYILVYDYTPILRLSDNNYPMYMPEVRQANPNTSFPIPYRDTNLIEWGYVPVLDTEIPVADVVWEGEPEQREDGKWYKTWLTRNFDENELAFNLQQRKTFVKAEAENAYRSDVSSRVMYNINSEDHIVSLEATSMTYLISCYHMLKAKNDPEFLIEYKFFDGSYVDLASNDFIKMVDDLISVNYDLTLKYWDFCKDVDSKTLIEDVPESPFTFL